MVNPRPLTWIKSSYSGGGGGSNCVEVAHVAETIAIRDSKLANGSSCPALAVSHSDWNGLLTALKNRAT